VVRVAATVLAGLTLAGCAGLGSDDASENVQSPSLITKADLNRYPPGSPADTFFEWWRALQFDNPLVAARYYSGSLEITPAVLDRQLQHGAQPLGLGRRPELVEVDKKGDKATVLVLLEAEQDNPNGRTDRVRTARAFNLVREHGEWKLGENLYLERQARLQKEFAEAVLRQQRDRSP
jgi:hypothetical protein